MSKLKIFSFKVCMIFTILCCIHQNSVLVHCTDLLLSTPVVPLINSDISESLRLLSFNSSYNFESFPDPTAEPIIDKGNCSEAFKNFSVAVVDFTNCSVNHARPVRICMECSEEYNTTLHTYNALKHQEAECLEYIFRSDQLAIVDIIFNGASALWTKSFCQNCYDYYDETLAFFNASENLNTCIRNFNITAQFLANSTCKECSSAYASLSNSYNTFINNKKEFDAGICMDIVDAMNISRRLWKQYDCISEFNTSIGASNVLTTLCFGFLPLAFYLLAKNVSRIDDIKIVQPKRKFTPIMTPEPEEVEHC